MECGKYVALLSVGQGGELTIRSEVRGLGFRWRSERFQVQDPGTGRVYQKLAERAGVAGVGGSGGARESKSCGETAEDSADDSGSHGELRRGAGSACWDWTNRQARGSVCREQRKRLTTCMVRGFA